MRTRSFPYQILLGKGDLLPICDVYLPGSGGRALVRALVDSGATHPIFPTKAAEDAGVALPQLANFMVGVRSGEHCWQDGSGEC